MQHQAMQHEMEALRASYAMPHQHGRDATSALQRQLDEKRAELREAKTALWDTEDALDDARASGRALAKQVDLGADALTLPLVRITPCHGLLSEYSCQ